MQKCICEIRGETMAIGTGLNKRIKYYRKKAGLTQENMSNELGIKVTNYVKYETGERNPKRERLMKISKILGTDYDNLVDGEENTVVVGLNRYIRRTIMGDIDGFRVFFSEFNRHSNVEGVVLDCFDDWDELIKESFSEFHSEFLEEPNIYTLAELDKRYRRTSTGFNCFHNERVGIIHESLDSSHMFHDEDLNDETIYKMAFCVAVAKYIEFGTDNACVSCIFADVREYTENKHMRDEDALKLFAVLVLVPFLDHIIDALELIAMNNSTIVDFGISFLHGGLSRSEKEKWDYLD